MPRQRPDYLVTLVRAQFDICALRIHAATAAEAVHRSLMEAPKLPNIAWMSAISSPHYAPLRIEDVGEVCRMTGRRWGQKVERDLFTDSVADFEFSCLIADLKRTEGRLGPIPNDLRDDIARLEEISGDWAAALQSLGSGKREF
jgi:hypothetical protein